MQAHVSLIKGGEGSGNFGHGGRPGQVGGSSEAASLPSSGAISSLADASAYYAEHLRGVWTLVIKRKAGLRRVAVDFRENEDHAYTKTIDGKRVFWPDRARRMSAIIDVLSQPRVILENGSRDLFVERAGADGLHDVVVLEWKDATRNYRFRSFHQWARDEFLRLSGPTASGGYRNAKVRGHPVEKGEAPIRKSVGASGGEHSDCSESPPAFPNLHRTTLAGSFELGEAHSGIGWPADGTLRESVDLVKSMSDAIDFLVIACPSLRFASVIEFSDDELPLGKALEPGERWITVHPPGHDKGTPLLIREHPDGTASVIGGAGGAMNHLKLRGIKPQGSYREALSDKAADRRVAKKEQLAQEKADGTHAEKQAARSDLKEKVAQVRRDFVQAVAQAAGWSAKDTEFDEAAHAGLSEPALAKAKADHEKKLFQRARDMVNINRKALVEDHDGLC